MSILKGLPDQLAVPPHFASIINRYGPILAISFFYQIYSEYWELGINLMNLETFSTGNFCKTRDIVQGFKEMEKPSHAADLRIVEKAGSLVSGVIRFKKKNSINSLKA